MNNKTNFVHVYIEIWDKGILKFNKFSIIYKYKITMVPDKN